MMSRTGKFTIGIFSLMTALPVAAQQAENVKQQEETLFSNPVFNVMLVMIILLLLVIIGMAEMVKAGAAQNIERAKKKKLNPNKTITGILLFLFAASTLNATSPAIDPATAGTQSFDYWGMGAPTFYVMFVIILFEVLIAAMLFRSGIALIKTEAANAVKKLRTEPSLLEKLNASVAVEQEESILMGHEYDGIRELDNDLPPWWKYGFYLTIVVAVVYLLHYHVFETGKLSLEEYEQEMKDGAIAVAEYQKNSKDLVDENTVKLLTDDATISEGKAIFNKNCIACHGEAGQGGVVGPNLTDDYWLYGGSLKDIYSSIKYGRPKGMKTWKDELGPAKIQAVVSFIKSLHGTNPPEPRAKEGELYIEEGVKPVTDTAKSAGDSLTITGIEPIKK